MATNNSINAPFPPFAINKGGTNNTSYTARGTIYFDGTKLNSTTTGTASQVLTSNGAGSAPTFQAFSTSSVFGSLSFGATAPAITNVTGDPVGGGPDVYPLGRDISLTTVFDNTGGAWNPATSGGGSGARFTAPATGVYLFSFIVNIYNDNNPIAPGGNEQVIQFNRNGTLDQKISWPTRFGVPGFFGYSPGGYAATTMQLTEVVPLSSGQFMAFRMWTAFTVGGGGAGGGNKVDGMADGYVFGFRIA